jgi:hypothetical protein
MPGLWAANQCDILQLASHRVQTTCNGIAKMFCFKVISGICNQCFQISPFHSHIPALITFITFSVQVFSRITDGAILFKVNEFCIKDLVEIFFRKF